MIKQGGMTLNKVMQQGGMRVRLDYISETNSFFFFFPRDGETLKQVVQSSL